MNKKRDRIFIESRKFARGWNFSHEPDISPHGLCTNQESMEQNELKIWCERVNLGPNILKYLQSSLIGIKHPSEFLNLSNGELKSVCEKSMMNDKEQSNFFKEIAKMKVHLFEYCS